MLKSTLFQSLRGTLEGEFHFDQIHRIIYATDASAYKEKPLGVAYPKSVSDIQKIIHFAIENKLSIVPRTAGTSLAGQVVGNGIIVDVSKHLTQIIELNKEEKWIRLQPGIVLDELNKFLEPHGLFFGPETSTSNRCMIGGMIGNNACGSHSIIYGSTRDHLLEVKALLSDGSEVEFKAITPDEFKQKCVGDTLENKLYRNIKEILVNEENQQEIHDHFPLKGLRRRNTGYAIDLLLETAPFSTSTEAFNFCKLIAGSEGTLAFITEIKLNLVPLPPKVKAVVAAHFHSLEDALEANLVALKYEPGAIELMDNTILELTKGNIEQQKNRFFLEGNPESILIIEFARETKEEIEKICEKLIAEMQKRKFGYHFPIVWGKDISRIWNLRKSGLGVLSNMQGDAKPVSLIEDTAVHVSKLPAYISEFKLLLEKYKLSCVYHAHIGSGELHLRPILNLKLEKDVEIFKALASDVALLVKKHKGSLSGEHGDGRLRGEFIPLMIGEHNYQLLKKIKFCWDENAIFNPGKITDTPPMNSSLRYEPGKPTKEIDTIFDFSTEMGIMRAVEKCNGSGDCRKTEIMGGLMCPSYQATRNEENTTRARANILRDYLTNTDKKNPFDHKEIYQIMDLCLSCKGCKSECPSNVDMAKFKAEFLQHYYDANGIPLRSWMIANISKINAFGSLVPGLTNLFLKNKFLMSLVGFAKERQMPLLPNQTLSKWYKTNYKNLLQNESQKSRKTVLLFNDEFTNYNDVETGICTITLLVKLGYEVLIPRHVESGRTFLSKGFVRKAKQLAEKNVSLLKGLVSEEIPLIGIEPSALLTFRDEYPDLVNSMMRNDAIQLAANAFLIDEFLTLEIKKGNINSDQFTDKKEIIKLHCHCQQKSIASSQSTITMLSIPRNYEVSEIPSGCCGMAGSFGYEKEHYELSKKIGELILCKQVRDLAPDTLVAAQGTSCRHQIKDGTNRSAFHPVEILLNALK